MYFALFSYLKAPTAENEQVLIEQLTSGFRKLQSYAQHAEQVISTKKLRNKNEVQQINT